MVKLQVVFLSAFLFVTSCAPRGNQLTDIATETEGVPVEPLSNPTPSYANERYVPDGHLRQIVDVYLPSEGEGRFPRFWPFTEVVSEPAAKISMHRTRAILRIKVMRSSRPIIDCCQRHIRHR